MKRSYLTFSFRDKKIAVKCKNDDELTRALFLVCTLRDATNIKVLDVICNPIVIVEVFETFIQNGIE